MSENVAAPAPTGGEALPETPVADAPAVDAPAAPASLDDELDAIFDKHEAGDEAEEPPSEDPAPEDAPKESEEAKAPTEIPKAISEHWAAIPEDARTAIVDAQRTLNQKNADLGRQVKALEPLTAKLEDARATLPGMDGKSPDQIAAEVFELSKFASAFTTDPKGTLLKLAAHHNVDLGVAPQGGDAPQGGELAAVRAELAQVRSELQDAQAAIAPANIENMTAQALANERSLAAVQEFSAKAEHWAAVEDHIPAAIAYIRAENGDSLSGEDLLSQAYSLAVSRHIAEAPKAKVEPSPPKAKAPPTPEKAKAAKDINIGASVSRDKEMSLDDQLNAIYDAHNT